MQVYTLVCMMALMYALSLWSGWRPVFMFAIILGCSQSVTCTVSAAGGSKGLRCCVGQLGQLLHVIQCTSGLLGQWVGPGVVSFFPEELRSPWVGPPQACLNSQLGRFLSKTWETQKYIVLSATKKP